MKTTFRDMPVPQWVFWAAMSVWAMGVGVSASVGFHRDAVAFGCGIIAAYLVLRGLKINDRTIV